jgi:hypothetical protein
MAQAECIITAIRELMSREGPPKSKSPVLAAHTEFVVALAGNLPYSIHTDVDSDELDGRAGHLEKAFAALDVYLTVMVADTAQNFSGGDLDTRHLDNLFQDLAAEALAVGRGPATARQLEAS